MSCPIIRITMTTTSNRSKIFPHPDDAAYIWAPWYRRLRIVLPLLAVVITAMLLALYGAGVFDPSGNPPSAEDAARAEAIVRTRIDREMTAGEDLPAYIRYRNCVLSHVQVQILSVNENKRTMKAEFAYPDMVSVTDSAAVGADNAEDFYLQSIAVIEQESCPRKTETLSLSYTADGQLTDSDEFLNVLSGGLLNALAAELKGAEKG